MLNFKDSFSVAVSSTAPFYSIMVTAPLIIALVGGGTPIIYLIAAIPSVLVCYSMQEMDKISPSKGTVYSWNNNKFLAWFSGYSLAITGIICTAGLSIFAADTIISQDYNYRNIIVFLLSALILILSIIINIKSIKIITFIQSLGIIIQFVAGCYIVYQVIQQGNYSINITGSFTDWVHAIILSIFAYWGFDAVFALTEESDKNVSQKTSIASIISLVLFFMIITYGVTVAHIDTTNILVSSAIIISAITAIGSTVIPTIRGIESMAENNDMPKILSDRTISSIIVTILIIIWSFLAVLIDGFFWDSVESVSIMVGIYFSLSCYAAYKNTRKIIHLTGLVLMSIITIIVLIVMFNMNYGETHYHNIGGVGIIVILLLISGLLMFSFMRNKDNLI